MNKGKKTKVEKKAKAPKAPKKTEVVAPVLAKAKQENKPASLYRNLNIKERDMLFAFYEKWNGNMSAMILDKDCIFKAYSQIHCYAHRYGFRERLIEKKRKTADDVMGGLKDAKIMALKNAVRLLEPSHHIMVDKRGMQVFDAEGKPLILEKLPYYKEIQAAWEIIKTELGEPTNIHKNDITSGGEKIQGNVIQFIDFNAPKS